MSENERTLTTQYGIIVARREYVPLSKKYKFHFYKDGEYIGSSKLTTYGFDSVRSSWINKQLAPFFK